MRRFSMMVAVMIGTAFVCAQPTFRSGVSMVRIDASVMNGTNAVARLTADNFSITDNGELQKVEAVTRDTVPLGLMLLLDTSESLGGEPIAALSNAARSLVNGLRVDDAAAVMTFADQVRLLVPPARDRGPILSALSDLHAVGATSINDAIVLALLHEPTLSPEMRPVMIVFTDGRDTSSWLDGGAAQQAARRSRTLIHVVELRGLTESATNFSRDLARAGGGRVWSAGSAGELRKLFTEVLNELRSRYLISYSYQGTLPGGWHDVKVKLKGARGEITARPGYFVSQ
jgi:VWFA-related protein